MNTLIITGGTITPSFAKQIINSSIFDCYIATDKGLEIFDQLQILPHHVVGDFDSISPEIIMNYQTNSKIIFHQYQAQKDYTDTDIALKLALNLKSDSIVILGAIGSRMDHTLANIHILKQTLSHQVDCKIIDENNRIQLLNHSKILSQECTFGKYISLIPLTAKVEGVTLVGFKYPLQNATLTIGESIGISNEMIAKIATISFTKGILIVIESKD